MFIRHDHQDGMSRRSISGRGLPEKRSRLVSDKLKLLGDNLIYQL
jgi:hypothetical protein